MFRKAPNKLTEADVSFERTARQLTSHQSYGISLRLSLSGGQPLNSSVMAPIKVRLLNGANGAARHAKAKSPANPAPPPSQ